MPTLDDAIKATTDAIYQLKAEMWSAEDIAALAHALALLEGLRWRPIETAPRDGEWILIGWFELPGQKHMHVAFWNSRIDAWCQIHQSFRRGAYSQPTHWMPLPTPPPQETRP